MGEGYRQDIGALRGASDPAKEFRAVVLYAADRTLDEKTGDIFVMLEARARHDAATASALDNFMRFYLETARDVLMRQHPGVEMQDAALAAVRLVAMIEGLSPVRSAAQAMGLSNKDLRDVVVRLAEEVRGGSVCLNRFGAFSKWFSASVVPPPLRVSAG